MNILLFIISFAGSFLLFNCIFEKLNKNCVITNNYKPLLFRVSEIRGLLKDLDETLNSLSSSLSDEQIRHLEESVIREIKLIIEKDNNER